MNPKKDEKPPRSLLTFSLVRKFISRRDGAASIEFCLLITPVIVVIIFTIYTAVFLFLQSALTTVVTTEARLIMTGEQAKLDESRKKSQPFISLKQQFFEDALRVLPSPISPLGFAIKVESADSWRDLKPDPYNWGYNPGHANSYVLVTASYKIPIAVNPSILFGGAFHKLDLPDTVYATSVVKAEPF